MTKIYILGSVGSGKTTLAKKLSKDLDVNHYELDNVVWKYNPNGDIRRTEEEIKEIFSKILEQDNWIIENVERNYFDKAYDLADTIIYLKLSRLTLYKRVIVRWIKQNLKIEKTTYKTDFQMLKQMLMWVDKEINDSKLNKLELYMDKVTILNEKTLKKYKYKEKI